MTAERNSGGAFASFTEFCNRMADKKLNKRIVESMIKSGVFDSIGLNRATLLGVYEGTIDSAVREQKNAVSGQLDFFSIFEEKGDIIADNFIKVPELDRRQLLNLEKEYLGIYVSGHPIDGMEDAIGRVSSASVLDIIENENNEFLTDTKVSIGGMISKRKDQLTKRGELMMYLTFEDLTGDIEVLVFPGQVRRFEHLLKEDNICVVTGHLDVQEERPPKIILENIVPLNTAKTPFGKLYLKLKSDDEFKFSEIKRVLSNKNGTIPVIIYYEDTKKSVQAPKYMWVSDNSVVPELSEILGKECVKTV